MPVAAIVLATQPAPWTGEALALLPWPGNGTLIEYVLAELAHAGVRDVETVLGHDAEAIIPLIAADNVEPVVDARWRSGRASSVRAGASVVVRGTDTALLIDVAAPRPARIYRLLLQQQEESRARITRELSASISAPCVVDEPTLAALRNVADDAALAAIVIPSSGAGTVDVQRPWGGLAIESRETYESALSLVQAEG